MEDSSQELGSMSEGESRQNEPTSTRADHQSSQHHNQHQHLRSYSSFSDASVEYAPSPNTCAYALQRANQTKIQTLLCQVMEQDGHDRLDTLRLLRKSLKEVDYHLAWLSQLDFFETLDRILRDNNWRVVNDCTLLLIDAIPRLQFDIDPNSIGKIFAHIIPNLGHKQSDVRRSTLLLLNMYINEHCNHFQQILKLLIDHGFTNHHNFNAQKGCILSLPLLLTDTVIQNQDLMPLMECLCELLVNSDTPLFYPLFLAMQRLHNIVGDKSFKHYLRRCHPEATILYNQAASRSNSVSSAADIQSAIRVSNTINFAPKQSLPKTTGKESPTRRLSRCSVASSRKEAPKGDPKRKGKTDSGAVSPATRRPSIKHLSSGEMLDKEGQHKNVTFDKKDKSQNGDTEESTYRPADVKLNHAHSHHGHGQDARPAPTEQQQQSTLSLGAKNSPSPSSQSSISSISSLSSTESSQATLVEPSQYINASYDQAIFYERPLNSTSRKIFNQLANSEMKFGIFPKQLIMNALSNKYPDKLEALQQMMAIMRESPINHLAILMTYFDSFLGQFLARLIDSGDYKGELIAIDMIDTIVVKTKVSTMAYIRPMVNLLIRGLGDPRPIFRENTIRVIHKIMTYLPPQQVIDAIFEHKHSKSADIREESINRITAAVLNFDKSEFNLTKLCYHVIPMLADQHRNVRLAALECLAVLAYALGPERIGSLLTAAEGVQTGCDYDGLLDAIHARLCRRALPRCNHDGSIRYVIKPYLSMPGTGHNRLSADVLWILQVPSYQSKYSRSNVLHLRASPTESELGHESDSHMSSEVFYQTQDEFDITRRRRRSSRQKSDPDLLSDIQQCVRSPSASVYGSPVQPMTDAGNLQNGDDSIGGGPTSGQRQSSYPFHIKLSARSNSQGSSSSVSTNKELFRYYLQKFKQSLTETKHTHLNTDSVPLPSDSIIYTDSPVVLNDPVEFASKLQQTSFDYDNEHQGTIPCKTRNRRGSTGSLLHGKHGGDSPKDDHIDNESVGSSSRSTTPVSVMERKIPVARRDSRQQQQELKRDDHKPTEAPFHQQQPRNRRSSSLQGNKMSKESSDKEEENNSSKSEPQNQETQGRRQSIKSSNRAPVANERKLSVKNEEQCNDGTTDNNSNNNIDKKDNNNDNSSTSTNGNNSNNQNPDKVDLVGSNNDNPPPSRQQQQQQLKERSHGTQRRQGIETDISSESTVPEAAMEMDRSELDVDSRVGRAPSDEGPGGSGELNTKELVKDDGQESSEEAITTKQQSARRDSRMARDNEAQSQRERDTRKASLASSRNSEMTKRMMEKEYSIDENDSISSQSSAKLIKTAMKLSELDQEEGEDNIEHQEGRQSDQEDEYRRESSSKEYMEHGTQTSGPSMRREHSISRARRDSRSDRRQSTAGSDPSDWGRRKASKSQPPPMSRGHSRHQMRDGQAVARDDYVANLAPSPSISASANIRHILENVAQAEGPFHDANIAFKVAMEAIEAPVWSTKVEGMLALIRLATFHQAIIVNNLHDVVGRTANETKNLRSTVSRSAIFALGDYCVKLKRLIEPELDTIVQALLAKSVENTAFIRDDIRKAFTCMVDELTPWRVAVSLIHHGSHHKNMHIRQMASQFIALLVERMGPTKCMVGSKDISDQLIPAAARFAMDSSPHTRFFGRKILSVLLNHSSFERLMRKHCTPSMFRNSLGIVESIRRRGVGARPQ